MLNWTKWRDCGINIQEIFENHFEKDHLESASVFFIALKMPYDQSTETKTHGSRNQQAVKITDY
jgi:hypothetical protein